MGIEDIPERIEETWAKNKVKRQGGEVKKLPGIKHAGTQEFANRVNKARKKEKMAKASRKKNRGKK